MQHTHTLLPIQNKRAAREASHGFHVEREAARITRFAAEQEEDQDMMAVTATGKHSQVGSTCLFYASLCGESAQSWARWLSLP